MEHRRSGTPDYNTEPENLYVTRRRGGSTSTYASYYSKNSSPNSIKTAGTTTTTPPRSPPKIREIGPTLLPRVRPQDQSVEYATSSTLPPGIYGHHQRTTSLPPQGYHPQYVESQPRMSWVHKRSASPSSNGQLLTPPSASVFDHHAHHPVPAHQRYLNVEHIPTTESRHYSRHSPSASMDPTTLLAYSFPTYRQSPGPQTAPPPSNLPAWCTATAMSHLAPMSLPNGQYAGYPVRRRTVSPSAPCRQPSIRAPSDLRSQYSSILEYLTAPNPTPSVVRRAAELSRGQGQRWFWYDIRNVEKWSDFNVNTIAAIPSLLDLLQINVSPDSLAQPARVNTSPETQADLAKMCASFHAVKVNASLKISIGSHAIAMCSLKPVAGGRPQPEFVCNLHGDAEDIMEGGPQGRVVGIVKCFDQWNSGMVKDGPNDKVKYLRGLAQLHYFMRQHGTRYGFIITEIELVCVRAGGSSYEAQRRPFFGSVEVAPPINISTHGRSKHGGLQMTVDLALWYLHMLAKDQPLRGQMHWKMDVGPPAALTRQIVRPRDTWIASMAGPSKIETREADRVRGWVWPQEGLARKETGHPRRRKTATGH